MIGVIVEEAEVTPDVDLGVNNKNPNKYTETKKYPPICGFYE